MYCMYSTYTVEMIIALYQVFIKINNYFITVCNTSNTYLHHMTIFGFPSFLDCSCCWLASCCSAHNVCWLCMDQPIPKDHNTHTPLMSSWYLCLKYQRLYIIVLMLHVQNPRITISDFVLQCIKCLELCVTVFPSTTPLQYTPLLWALPPWLCRTVCCWSIDRTDVFLLQLKQLASGWRVVADSLL